VTKEGERLVGSGEVKDLERWNNDGKFGFKIKIAIKKQKSLSDRRVRLEARLKRSAEQADLQIKQAAY
jgi:hypothetical protein